MFMVGFWIGLYSILHRLIWMNGTWAAFGGLLVGPVLQCYYVPPANYSIKEYKEIILVCLAATVLFIPMQILCLALCLTFFNFTGQSYFSLTSFYVVRIVFNNLVE
jgi:hypothetical protein